MATPTIKDLFTPINSISACINTQGQAISKELSDINNTIIGAASSLSDKIDLMKETVEKSAGRKPKSLKDTVDTRVGKRAPGITVKKIEQISRDMAANITAGTGKVADAVTLSSRANSEASENIAAAIGMTNAVLYEISETVQKEFRHMRRRNRTESARRRADSAAKLDVGKVTGTGDAAKAVRDIATAVEAVGSVKMKDVILFRRKLSMMVRGVTAPIKEYNEAMDGIDGKATGEAMETLGKGLGNFVKSMSKVAIKAEVLAKTAARKEDGSLYKVIRNTTYAVLTGLYGAKYDEETGRYSNLDTEAPKRLARAGEALDTLGSDILKFNTKMTLSAVLSLTALAGAGAFRLEVPLIKSAIDKLLGDDAKTSADRYKAGSEVLDGVSSSILAFNAKLALSAVLAVPAAIGLGASALLVMGASALIGNLADKNTERGLDKGSKTLDRMAGAILGFEAYMVLGLVLAPVAALGLALSAPLVLGTYAMFNTIGSKGSARRVKSASLSIMLMGASMMMFSLSMLATTMITRRIITGGDGKIDPEDIAAIATAVPVFGLMLAGAAVTNRMGSPGTLEDSARSFLSITLMSAGLVVFSLGMLAATKITKNMWRGDDGKADPLAIITSVSVFGLMFAGVKLFEISGRNVQSVGKGFLSIAAISAGLAVFGYGLKFYAKSTKSLDRESLMAMPVLLAGFAAEFWAMGAASEFIIPGGIAAAAMGAGVGVFGYGLSKYAEFVNGISFKEAMRMAGIIGVYGAEFAAIGFASAPILAADAAFAAMGGSLAVFGKGMSVYMESIDGYGEEELGTARKNINRIGWSFAALGTMTPLLAGAGAATAIIGKGLANLGKGMGEWNSVSGKVTTKSLDTLVLTVDRLKYAFMGDVDENGKPVKRSGAGKLLKNLVGTISTPFNVAVVSGTAASLRIASKTIPLLATALKSWESAGIKDGTIDGFTGTMVKLGASFAALGGKSGSAKTSVLKLLTGADFSAFTQTDVELGIRSTRNMGKALNSIAKGIIEFRDGIGKQFSDPAKAQELGDAISNVITPLHTAFAAIGNQESVLKRQKGMFARMFNDLFGELASPASKTAVANGIKSTRGLGRTLRQLAEGTKEFANLIPKNAGASWLKDVGDNIAAVLTAVMAPFAALDAETYDTVIKTSSKKVGNAMAEVHKSMDVVSSISRKSESVKAGVESVKGLGETLKSIADATKSFSEISAKKLGKAGEWNDDWGIKTEGTGALGAMTSVMCSQFALFAKLGKSVKETGTYEEIQKDGNWFSRKKTSTAKSYIGLAVDSMANLGSVIKDIGEGLAQFSDTKWKDGAIAGAADAFRTILAFTESFGMLAFVMSKKEYDGKNYNALDTGTWDAAAVKKFGVISGRATLIVTGKKGLITGAETVVEIVKAYNEASKGINDNSEALKALYEKPEVFMYPLYNIIEACRMLSASESLPIGMLDKTGKLSTFGVNTLSEGSMKSAKSNIKEIKAVTGDIQSVISSVSDSRADAGRLVKNTDAVVSSINRIGKNKITKDTADNADSIKAAVGSLSEAFKEIGKPEMERKSERGVRTAKNMEAAITPLVSGMERISGMKPAATDAFPKLIGAINKSLKTLDGKGGKLKQATLLVSKLTEAKKANVFDNMAGSARSIASAINSLNNENMKPYAEMISALGKMSERDSRYKELFDDIVRLLKNLNKELEEGRTRPAENPFGGQKVPFAPWNQQQGQQQPSPRQDAPARREPAANYTAQLSTIIERIGELKTAIENNQ